MSEKDKKSIRALFPAELTREQLLMYREIEQIGILRSSYMSWPQQKMFFERHYYTSPPASMQPRIAPPKTLQEFLSAFRLTLMACEEDLTQGIKEMLSWIPLCPEHEAEWKALSEKKWIAKLQSAVKSEADDGAVPRLRLMLLENGAHVQIAPTDESPFTYIKQQELRRMLEGYENEDVNYDIVTTRILQVIADDRSGSLDRDFSYRNPTLVKMLRFIIQDPALMTQSLFMGDEQPVRLSEQMLGWSYREVGDQQMELFLLKEGQPLTAKPWMVIPGRQPYLLTSEGFDRLPFWPQNMPLSLLPWLVPKSALFSTAGYALLKKMKAPIPAEMAAKVIDCTYQVTVKCWLLAAYSQEMMRLSAVASIAQTTEKLQWSSGKWNVKNAPQHIKDVIVQADDALLKETARWLQELPLKGSQYTDIRYEEMRVTKAFPDLITDWLSRRPRGVELFLDKELNDLAHGKVAGSVGLEIEESAHGLDWFDINVRVTVSDAELSQEEISLLLKAKGKWVKLGKKGWRKLDYQVTEEVQQELAEIGLSAHDLQGEKQRLHALQLGALAKRKSSLLAEKDQQRVSLRIDDIQTRVTPAVPASIMAQLRPYQEEGYHFLAYLSTNQFGGVLADDMGLGKTLQALTWLAWLREKQGTQGKKKLRPSLVVAPKSVQENWHQETQRFFSSLRSKVWRSGDTEKELDPAQYDLLVVNYAQLRHWSDELQAIHWQAVIVDEAQNIKNPSSQSTQAVRALTAEHRLALTGTPIENRLMDLWSIFSFAMPGVLGSRMSFAKSFDKSKDPLARKRLSALTRPFLMRRTKKEVAQDLPDRIEEDMSVSLEGEQATLYQAELKRARAHLLKAKLPGQLDQMRFHLLTSLLRLRQICCHPGLLGVTDDERSAGAPSTSAKKAAKKAAKKMAKSDEGATTSAKLDALLDLLEPLMEEGQKVLVFSQFVGMLDLIREELVKRNWKNFYLSGQTDHRGALVESFQSCEEAAVFLISLKAGGAGLNLTSASYVVLFDPWWNPAVEAQAIDRTHRIGQKSTVIAYRLVAKDTIEEKIRQLQQHKSAMALDILGEENFARALSLDDFQYLLADEPTAAVR